MKRNTFLEQPRRGNTHEVQLTPHKAKPQCGAHEVQITPHKAKPQCGAHEVQITPHKAKPQCGAHEVQITPHKAKPQCGAHEVQITPYKAEGRNVGRIKASKGRSVGAVAVILLVISVLATACNKPEKQMLEGSWQWAQTSGGIAGVNYTPESESFEAVIVFKNNKFTFYKDGKKVTSGNYQIDEWETREEDEMPHPDVLFRSTIHFPEVTCKEIAKATDGKISLYPSSIVLLDIITEDYQSLTFHSNNMVDDFWVTFGKK